MRFWGFGFEKNEIEFYCTNLKQNSFGKPLNILFKHISSMNDPTVAVIIPIFFSYGFLWFSYDFLWFPMMPMDQGSPTSLRVPPTSLRVHQQAYGSTNFHRFPVPIFTHADKTWDARHFRKKKTKRNEHGTDASKNSKHYKGIPLFTKIIFSQDGPRFFLYSLKHSGIIKWMSMGFYGFENP